MGVLRVDRKLESIRGGTYRPTDFIIADAKDGEMGGGIHVAGPAREPKTGAVDGFKPYAVYNKAIAEMTRADLVDVMLMAPSMGERLCRAGLFADSQVTPAVRLNEATDIWGARGSSYKATPAEPFRTVRPKGARAFCDLGLYSITFYNDRDRDTYTLNEYRAFREEAAAAGMRHFLEVFNPAFPIDTGDAEIGAFINDSIVRCLAGVLSDEHPLFLKIAFNGVKAMEELAGYDPERIVVGILGGGAGTTRDTFELLAQAHRAGARVALFGRKINLAEDPVRLVGMMRQVIEDGLDPKDAVAAYHDALGKAGIAAARALADDSAVTEEVLKAGHGGRCL